MNVERREHVRPSVLKARSNVHAMTTPRVKGINDK